MSHTLRKVNLGNSAFAEVTIVDYVSGGESFTLAELGLTGALTGTVFLTQASYYATPTSNIIPRFNAGVVLLEIGPGLQLPSTVGLNFTFVAIVNAT